MVGVRPTMEPSSSCAVFFCSGVSPMKSACLGDLRLVLDVEVDEATHRRRCPCTTEFFT